MAIKWRQLSAHYNENVDREYRDKYMQNSKTYILQVQSKYKEFWE